MENATDKQRFAKLIEEQTAKIPSDFFLWTAGGAMLFALGYFLAGKKLRGILLSQLASPLLVIGLYKKLIQAKDDSSNNSGVQKAESANSIKQGVFQHQE
jgi:hypothetical protein